jgi:hypothetical protein
VDGNILTREELGIKRGRKGDEGLGLFGQEKKEEFLSGSIEVTDITT